MASLGVHPGEERSVALMTSHAFFMGASTVFFETAASAFFLARFEAKALPWVYVAAALVNLVAGSVYARAQRRVSFGWLMKGTLLALLAGVLLARLGFAVSSASWIVFAGMVGYRLLSSLTDLEYWAVASRIYDVRQAKRLFGLIGTGEVVARTLGAFTVPLVVRSAGVGNLLVLSAVSLGCCLALVSRVLGRGDGGAPVPAPSATAPGGTAPPTTRLGLRAIAARPYLGQVVAVAVAATLGKYLVDFAFLEQLSLRSRDDVALASYLGLFAGLTQALSLLARLFVSRPLLARFGVRVGVLVLPLVQLACTLALVTSGALGASAVVFWLVLANQGLYKTLKHPIDNASFKVLYQPLAPVERLGAQIAVEVVLAPIVVGVSGAVMLLFSAVMSYDPVRFGLVLLATFGLWSWLAWRAGRGYLRALLDLLHGEDGPASTTALPAEAVAGLASLEPGARGERLASLDRDGHEATGATRDELRRLARDEAREAALLLGAWRDLAASPWLSELRAALVREVEQARERAFAATACSHDRTAIGRARRSLTSASREQRAYAHEVLDLALSPSERGYLLPLLEELAPADRLARLGRVFAEPARGVDERLRQLMARPAGALTAATRALVSEAASGRGREYGSSIESAPANGAPSRSAAIGLSAASATPVPGAE